MKGALLDLSEVPVVDGHAHACTRIQPATPAELRAHFSEANAPGFAEDHVGTALHYRWTLRMLADGLGIEPTEEALLGARSSEPLQAYAKRLMHLANLQCVLLDEGFPPPSESYSTAGMGALLGVPVAPMLRIETLVQDLIPAHEHFADLLDAFDRAAEGAKRAGYIALKSIAAYRTGLKVESVSERDATVAHTQLRGQWSEGIPVRLQSKPLIDFFVLRALGHAAAQGLPVQFHTGYGDPDLDLRLANPLHLRPLFEDARLTDVPIVLLHESWPFTAEAAFLAASYPNAYMDLAFSLPPLDRRLLRRSVETALGAAPASKIMVSSDGTCIPEHYYLAAARARDILGDVLGESIEGNEISTLEGERLGEMVLRGNAARVYGLHS
jgi:hypothetical protein